MTDYLSECREELNSKIEGLIELFDDFDFELNGCTKSDVVDLESLLKVLGQTKKLPSYASFRKLIKGALFTDDEDLEELDWEPIEIKYDEVLEEFTAFNAVLEQISDNITGAQRLDGVKIYQEEQIKQYLFELFVEKNQLYEIDTPDGTHYLINAELETEIENAVGFD